MTSYSKAPTLPIPPEMKITSLRPMASPPSTTLHKIPPYPLYHISLFCSDLKLFWGTFSILPPFYPPQWVGYLPARRRYVIHVSLEVCVSLAFSSHYVVGGRSMHLMHFPPFFPHPTMAKILLAAATLLASASAFAPIALPSTSV